MASHLRSVSTTFTLASLCQSSLFWQSTQTNLTWPKLPFFLFCVAFDIRLPHSHCAPPQGSTPIHADFFLLIRTQTHATNAQGMSILFAKTLQPTRNCRPRTQHLSCVADSCRRPSKAGRLVPNCAKALDFVDQIHLMNVGNDSWLLVADHKRCSVEETEQWAVSKHSSEKSDDVERKENTSHT